MSDYYSVIQSLKHAYALRNFSEAEKLMINYHSCMEENYLGAALILAAHAGDLNSAAILLSCPKTAVNLVGGMECGDIQEGCALVVAVRKGYLEIVKLLLAHPKIAVNICGKCGGNAIVYADGEILQMLLDHPDMDPNFPGLDGRTALRVAAEYGQIDKINMLLLTLPSLDIHKLNKDGRSAIHVAATPEIFALLTAYGPNAHVVPAMSWLAVRLRSSGVDASMIVLCERALVDKECFLSERTFGLYPLADFNIAYLTKVGIVKGGVQAELLAIHRELHSRYNLLGAGHNSGNKNVDILTAQVAALQHQIQELQGGAAALDPVYNFRSAENMLDPVYVSLSQNRA